MPEEARDYRTEHIGSPWAGEILHLSAPASRVPLIRPKAFQADLESLALASHGGDHLKAQGFCAWPEGTILFTGRGERISAQARPPARACLAPAAIHLWARVCAWALVTA